MEALAGAASVIAIIQLADRVVDLCGTYAVNVASAKSDIEKLVGEIKSLRDVTDSIDSASHRNSKDKASKVEEALSLCEMELTALEQKLEPKSGRKMMSKVGLRALTWPFRSKDVEKIIIGLERRKTSLLLALSVEQNLRSVETQQYALLSKLENAKNARFNAESETSKPFCQSDTRIHVLQQINDWIQNADAKPVFWLIGMAGTGKSTIARTIARDLEEQKLLGASFFFSRGEEDLSTVRKLTSTIVSQLCVAIPGLGAHVASVLEENAQIVFENPREQWRQLVIKPIQQLTGPRNIFLVLDALDECDGDNTGQGLKLVLQLISETIPISTVGIKIIITSRPEMPIKAYFDSTLKGLFEALPLHLIDPETLSHDIDLYLRHELELFREECGVSKGWPKNSDLKILSSQANGLFIYAATIVRFERASKIQPPGYRLSKLLQNPTTKNSPTGQLDRIYGEVLRLGLLDDDNDENEFHEHEESFQRFRSVFSPLPALYDPLNPSSLANLARIDHHISFSILQSIPSLIFAQQNRPITLLHPSFRDYLFNEQRCSNASLHIDRVKAHKSLALHCLDCLRENLSSDICNLKDPGCRRSFITPECLLDSVPGHLRYACRYWIDHLESGDCVVDLADDVLVFLESRLLQWIEVLALFGWVSDAIKLVQKLLDMFSSYELTKHETRSNLSQREMPVTLMKSVSIREFLADTKHLLSRFQHGIDRFPLQIYGLATIFSPQSSAIHNTYHNLRPDYLFKEPSFHSRWDQTLYSLEGNKGVVMDVCFSPNLKLLAAGLGGGECKLWDMDTGSVVYTLNGHTETVNSVVFADDCTLVSGSVDTTIKIWDVNTGVVVATLRGHTRTIYGLWMAPTRKVVLSASHDQTLKVWDVQQQTLLTTLTQHHEIVSTTGSTCCYHFGERDFVAIASCDKTVKIWDLECMQLIRTLKHNDIVTFIVCHPDASVLVTKELDGVISLWNPRNGEFMRELAIEEPHRHRLGYLSSQNTLITLHRTCIEYWNLDTQSRGFLIYEDEPLSSTFSFSRDASLLAVTGYSNSVRVLQLDSRGSGDENVEPIVAAKSTFANKLHFVATAQRDCGVNVWCTDSESLRYRLKYHNNPIKQLIFSEDDTLLASVDESGVIVIWNLDTGQIKARLLHIDTRVDQAIFVGNDLLIAAKLHQTSTKIWSLETSAVYQEINHGDRAWLIKVSKDKKWLAIGLEKNYRVIQIWDLVTGMFHLEIDHKHTQEAAFSGNCKYLASRSWDSVVVHELSTGKQLLLYDYHEDSPYSDPRRSGDGTGLALSYLGDYVALRGYLGVYKIVAVTRQSAVCTIPTSGQVVNHCFSADDKALHSQYGRISLEYVEDEQGETTIKPFKDIVIEHDWLILHGQRVLWIPAERRRNLVVLPGYRVGFFDRYKFTVMQLKPPV